MGATGNMASGAVVVADPEQSRGGRGALSPHDAEKAVLSPRAVWISVKKETDQLNYLQKI